VAILDADKEGFLRSERSLIQTMGRAARHLKGKAILYAARVTGSMQKAIKVTQDRRLLQDQFNKDNNIQPQGLNKAVNDVMQLGQRNLKKGNLKLDKVAEFKAGYQIHSEQDILKQIAKLEKQMFAFAKELEFEKAAQIRDQVSQLHDQLVSMG